MTKSINHIRVRIADVVEATVEVSGLHHHELLSERKPARLTYWRQRAYVAAYHLTGQSTVAIGRHFNKDHSTIIQMMKKARERDMSPDFVADITRIAERAIDIAEARGMLRRAA